MRRQKAENGPQKDWLACSLSEDQASSYLSIYLFICFPIISRNEATNKVLHKLWYKTRVAYVAANMQTRLTTSLVNMLVVRRIYLQHTSVVILSAEQIALAMDHLIDMEPSCSERAVFGMRGFHLVRGGPCLARCSDLAVSRNGNVIFHVLVELCDRSELLSGTN